MKNFIFGLLLMLLLGQSAHGSSQRRLHYLTPAEKKYVDSLHKTYDPFKDVRLNDKRPTSSLPLLTAKNLKEHRKALNTKLYEKNNSVPPLILDRLKKEEYEKWAKNPRHAQFMK